MRDDVPENDVEVTSPCNARRFNKRFDAYGQGLGLKDYGGTAKAPRTPMIRAR